MTRFSRVLAQRAVSICFLFIPLCGAKAQGQDEQQDAARPRTVSALLVSDIHFEPFWDSAKAAQLESAPARSWDAILAAAPSADRQQRFDALQDKCHARGPDTPYALFKSSLTAIRSKAGAAGFVVVSGDLVAHAFSCKYSALFPQASPQAYRAFVVKTLDYVLHALRKALPGVGVQLNQLDPAPLGAEHQPERPIRVLENRWVNRVEIGAFVRLHHRPLVDCHK